MITYNRYNKYLILQIALAIVCAFNAQAQESSQGNTSIFGGGQMSFFGNHNFITGGAGTQPGVILTERAAGNMGYLNFVGDGLTSTGADDANYVDGYVRKYGTGSFVFPVGDNSQIGQFAANADGTSGAYFYADPNVAVTSNLFTGANYPALPATGPFSTSTKAANVNTVSTIEYWDIDGVNAANLTLTWDAGSDVTGLTSSIIGNLTIVGWNATTLKWEAIPSTVDVTSVLSGASTLTSGSITTDATVVPNTYSAYTLGSVLALPDLTTTIRISPSAVIGDGKTINVRILVSEILGAGTTGNIYVLVPTSPHFTMNTYSPTQFISQGLPVQNINWSYLGVSGLNHIFQYGGTAGATTLPGSTSSAFGFSIVYSANSNYGTDNMVASIFDGSGGETNFLNNKDNEDITFSGN